MKDWKVSLMSRNQSCINHYRSVLENDLSARKDVRTKKPANHWLPVILGWTETIKNTKLTDQLECPDISLAEYEKLAYYLSIPTVSPIRQRIQDEMGFELGFIVTSGYTSHYVLINFMLWYGLKSSCMLLYTLLKLKKSTITTTNGLALGRMSIHTYIWAFLRVYFLQICLNELTPFSFVLPFFSSPWVMLTTPLTKWPWPCPWPLHPIRISLPRPPRVRLLLRVPLLPPCLVVLLRRAIISVTNPLPYGRHCNRNRRRLPRRLRGRRFNPQPPWSWMIQSRGRSLRLH